MRIRERDLVTRFNSRAQVRCSEVAIREPGMTAFHRRPQRRPCRRVSRGREAILARADLRENVPLHGALDARPIADRILFRSEIPSRFAATRCGRLWL